MKQIIKKLIAAASLLLVVGLTPTLAYAETMPMQVGAATPSASKSAACDALNELDDTKGCGQGVLSVGGLVNGVVNILSIVVGIAAVIMIIISGFKYVTSSGDSGSIASAKSTLIYALVGLAIAVSAQLLVRFVFNQVK